MKCIKYTLVNTGTTLVNFNYQKCDSYEIKYQITLFPNQSKTFWAFDKTLEIAQDFKQSILFQEIEDFPPPTPSQTQQITPTPTITSTPTNTPTPTITSTPTVTPTPSTTEQIKTLFMYIPNL